MRGLRSVKTKTAAVVLFVMAALAVLLFFMNLRVTDRYKALQTAQCQSAVDAQSQEVNAIISIMENNVQKLALIGQQLAENPAGAQAGLGKSAVQQGFPAQAIAVGGGVFFEPYALNAQQERVCYYAFRDTDGKVVFDPVFESEQYSYLTQDWYTTIKAGALASPDAPVWTTPYYDDAGTNALMVTVGFGIFLDGAFIGVATGDWVLTDIAQSIAAIKPTPGSNALFGDLNSGMVLTYTAARSNVSASLSDFPWLNDALETGSAEINGKDRLVFSNILSNRMAIVSIVPSAELFAEINESNRGMQLTMGIACVLIVAITLLLLTHLISKPLTTLNAGVKRIAAGDLTSQIHMNTGDEMQALATSVNTMAQDLRAYIQNLTQMTAEKERIGAELDVATQIQASMLPCIFPAFPERAEFDIFALMQPAKEVGGDFYDFFLVDDNTLAVVMADVSGKGVPAALFMVIAKTLLKNNAQNKHSPKQVFETVNNLLCEGNDSAMFVTAFMGYLDIPTGEFTFVNAGHNLPLIRRAGEPFEWLSTPRGFVLGGMEDTFYKQEQITLHPGDELFLYTDGVTEATNRENALFSDERLLHTANELRELEPREYTISLKQAVEAFADGAEQADDITMLTLRITQNEEEEL